MIENLQECGINPIGIGLLALLGVGIADSVYQTYKCYKRKSIEPEGKLSDLNYETLRELRESSILNEDSDKFYINKKNLTPYDLERLAEE